LEHHTLKPSALNESTPLLNLEPGTAEFLRDVIAGLDRSPKSLPCKYFYDERGSKLFDRICELDEYYVTRTELAIMERHADEIGHCLSRGSALVELGSGSSIKTRLLLDHASHLSTYVPVDISLTHLSRTAEGLAQAYPKLAILPVCADFTQPFDLPVELPEDVPITAYFPGSTIGNFSAAAASQLLENLAQMVHRGGGLLIGVDLRKDRQILEAAYDDSEGVTAEFNLNLLRRINRELDADFNLDQFEHQASYNEDRGRMEIDLVSKSRQQVYVGDQVIELAKGEAIRTEHSHKYTVEGFSRLAGRAGWELDQAWTDDRNWFAVMHFFLS
jgi:dimethylhistidine N-methyltransferase